MSARDRLLDVLNGNCNPLEPPESLIDAYAHELAEKQREAIRKTDDPVFYGGEAGWLPDLIDPEVTDAS